VKLESSEAERSVVIRERRGGGRAVNGSRIFIHFYFILFYKKANKIEAVTIPRIQEPGRQVCRPCGSTFLLIFIYFFLLVIVKLINDK
jgi:hypothetical protein